jgi:hypothetical protein
MSIVLDKKIKFEVLVVKAEARGEYCGTVKVTSLKQIKYFSVELNDFLLLAICACQKFCNWFRVGLGKK